MASPSRKKPDWNKKLTEANLRIDAAERYQVHLNTVENRLKTIKMELDAQCAAIHERTREIQNAQKKVKQLSAAVSKDEQQLINAVTNVILMMLSAISFLVMHHISTSFIHAAI